MKLEADSKSNHLIIILVVGKGFTIWKKGLDMINSLKTIIIT